MSLSTCVPTAAIPCNFTCCSLGPATSERVYYGQPQMGWGAEVIVQLAFFLLLVLGGLLNLWSPTFTNPKSALAPFFYSRIGSAAYLRVTPAEAAMVTCVIVFYVARFIGFYRLYSPYEISLEPGFPGSNGAARACAQALEQVWHAALPIQISLSVKNMWWWWFAGLPLERLSTYHNHHGYFMCLVLVTAWICYAIGGLTTRTLTSRFCFCDINPLGGLIALICQVLLTLMSLPIVRRKYWEYFYLMGHFQLLFPMMWGMFFNNRVEIVPFYVLSFMTWGWTDLPMRIYMKVFQPTRVLSASVKANDSVVELRMTKRKADGSGKTLGLLTNQWEAGSYIWLAVRMPNANPLKGKAPPPFSLDWACYHPMTISSPPIDTKGHAATDFTIHVKSMGPGTWSQALVDKVGQMARDGVKPEELKVWVGGPNGKLAISPYDCDKVVLIAGGIGVTPMIALAQELAIRQRVGPPGKDGKGGGTYRVPTPPEVELAYIERHLSNFSAFDDALTYLTSTTEGVEPLSSKTKLKLYCTQPGTQGDSAMSVHGVSVTAGRPKFMELLAEAADVKPSPEKKLVIGVYSCGPPKMMAAVRAAVQGASNSAAKFYLHEETFEL
jgi:hypothetical protein